MFTQMMESEMNKDSPFHEHISVIKRNTDACKKTVQSLLNHSYKSKPSNQNIDLNNVLKDAMIFIQPMCNKENIELEVEYLREKIQIFADPTQFRQVITNLLMNGVHSIISETKTKRCIYLRTSNETNKNQLIIDVEDTGSGIPEDIKDKIFTPFFTTKEMGKGTGLGLPTSKRIIEAHGGTLELIHSSSKGSLFRIQIPIKQKEKNK